MCIPIILFYSDYSVTIIVLFIHYVFVFDWNVFVVFNVPVFFVIEADIRYLFDMWSHYSIYSVLVIPSFYSVSYWYIDDVFHYWWRSDTDSVLFILFRIGLRLLTDIVSVTIHWLILTCDLWLLYLIYSIDGNHYSVLISVLFIPCGAIPKLIILFPLLLTDILFIILLLLIFAYSILMTY